MAIFNSYLLGKAKKSVGNITLCYRNLKNIAQAKVFSRRDNPTPEVLDQRARVRVLGKLGRRLLPAVRKGFVGVGDGTTSNAFMSENMGAVEVTADHVATVDFARLKVASGLQDEPQVEVVDKLDYFPSQLPAVRASKVSSWVSISVGCNNTCTFCIVPTTRGKEHDRRPGDILDEVRRCVEQGAKEVTLLGQNVNSFGYGIGDRYAFSKLLRACGTIEGLERVRFTSPHPAAFTDDVIAAMAQTPNVMHQLHMPLQSGSDRILRAMRRSYRTAKFMDILRKVREAMPDAQISTDIIVGFPGETEEDFEETMRIVEEARFSSAFTFEYSPRPGTPAAAMEQVPKDVVQERFERLVALQERITEEEMAKFEGRDVEVMITGTHGKKDAATHRVTGRERTGVLVHVGVPEGEPMPEVGDFVTATVTHAARHNLIADPDPKAGQTYHVRH